LLPSQPFQVPSKRSTPVLANVCSPKIHASWRSGRWWSRVVHIPLWCMWWSVVVSAPRVRTVPQ
jgi:hypothetical protein